MITLLAGNQRILLTVDETGNWTNLYYPYAGQYQHARDVKLGLFDEKDGSFSWLGEDRATWTVEQRHGDHTNTAVTVYRNPDNVEVKVTDMVHSNHDLIIRKIEVKDLSGENRKLRVFCYHSLTIAESMYQDTAYWDEGRKTVNHYKRNYYFQFWGAPHFDQFTCGEHTLKGLQGSYRDAEDGKLEGGRVSHGAADSAVGWNLSVPANGQTAVHLLVCIGGSRKHVNQVHDMLSKRDVNHLVRECTDFWVHWLNNKKIPLAPNLSEQAQRVYNRSIFVLRNCSSHNGSVIASPDPRTLKSGGDTYNYCWWRDGGYISKAMDEVGLYEQSHKFLQFAMKCQEEEGYFIHRHFPDGTVGSTWHPPPFIQIDQTSTVISAVWHHFKRHGDLDQLLEMWPLVKNGANFIVDHFMDERGLPLPSYDLWEERKAVNAYSCASVIHGLERAERIAEQLGKSVGRWREASNKMREATLKHLWNEDKGAFFKAIDPVDTNLDASTLLAIKLGVLKPGDKRAEQLVHAIETRLWNHEVGGICRYEGDTYYGPENPWIICTLWLAEAHLMLGRPERCRELIEWSARTALDTDLLAEQVEAKGGAHTSVTPLVWSHSTFIDVVNKYTRMVAEKTTDDGSE